MFPAEVIESLLQVTEENATTKLRMTMLFVKTRIMRHGEFVTNTYKLAHFDHNKITNLRRKPEVCPLVLGTYLSR